MPGIYSTRTTNSNQSSCGAGLSMGIGNKSSGTTVNRATNKIKMDPNNTRMPLCEPKVKTTQTYKIGR